MRLLVTPIGFLCALVALTMGMTRESPPDQPLPAPELSITVSPASLVIDGTVSSEGHEAILSRTVARLFADKSVQIDVAVRPAMPPGWALITDLTLQAMVTTRSGTAAVTPERIGISGITNDADAWSRAAQSIKRSLLDGQAFEQHVEAVGSPASLERQCIALFRTAIRGRRIEFPLSGATLGTAAHPLLDELIQIAVDCPAASIRITGHTDHTGEEAVNSALSRARAEAVANYLIARGISASRIETRGAGSTEPLVDGANARARRLNRRIDIDLRFP